MDSVASLPGVPGTVLVHEAAESGGHSDGVDGTDELALAIESGVREGAEVVRVMPGC